MTGKEYRRLREELGMSRAELARRVGRHHSIITRREKGDRAISTEAELALRWVLHDKARRLRAAEEAGL